MPTGAELIGSPAGFEGVPAPALLTSRVAERTREEVRGDRTTEL